MTRTYWIVPEFKRDPTKTALKAGYFSRVRYTIRQVSFPSWHKEGIIKDLDTDLSLVQAKRKLKSWRAYARKHRNDE